MTLNLGRETSPDTHEYDRKPPYHTIIRLPASRMFGQASVAHLHSTSRPLLELWKQIHYHQNLTLK